VRVSAVKRFADRALNRVTGEGHNLFTTDGDSDVGVHRGMFGSSGERAVDHAMRTNIGKYFISCSHHSCRGEVQQVVGGIDLFQRRCVRGQDGSRALLIEIPELGL
jgi:hypothetical protein